MSEKQSSPTPRTHTQPPAADVVGGTRTLEARAPVDSESIVSELMMPGDVNNVGNVFGGVILSMVDRAAAVAGMRHTSGPVVTVSIDRVEFREPIYAGELVTCCARLNYVGRTSMEIGVQVEAENLLTGVRRHTNACLLTFVSIDKDMKPIPVRPLLVETEEEHKRFRDAERRRVVRRLLAKEEGQPLG